MNVNIINGDCRDILPTLAADSFDCVVTSPPYWGLRDYGVEGQIGLEPTMQEYLETMVVVCRELRRVLKPGGTFWLNIGDSYAGAGGFRATAKAKDLCLIPNRLAILLQEDGWYVRSEIIWHKPNPMPESVRDRPTSAHEKVWLLTKGLLYKYDWEAIAETTEYPVGSREDVKRGGFEGKGADPLGQEAFRAIRDKRNARNVWSIASQPFPGSHFATMPPALAERCIKAGCPVGGSVLDPFGGAGTTGLVADRLGRHATLIELNQKYVDMAASRVQGDSPLFAEVSA